MMDEDFDFKRKKELMEGLPHLYNPHYEWSLKFFNSTNRQNFLTAANQVGKSTVAIRKCIHWATASELWPKLWDTKPRLFRYMYPDKGTAHIEWLSKWAPLMPQGVYKNHPKYGWREQLEKGKISKIFFNSGVIVDFKFYSQSVMDVQGSTVHAIFCDEEPPLDHFEEAIPRLSATNGYFHAVFTATRGQEYLRLTMEEQGTPKEKHPSAHKQQVSAYECLVHTDGSPGHKNKKDIDKEKSMYATQSAVDRRIYGRFV